MSKEMFSVTTQMRKLRERAGLSMDELARAMGYARASSIQRYENGDDFRKEYFAMDLTLKLTKVLVGHGTPPIAKDEVAALGNPDARIRLLSGMGHVHGESLAQFFDVNDDSARFNEPAMQRSALELHDSSGQPATKNLTPARLPYGGFEEDGFGAGMPQSNATIAGNVSLSAARRLPVYGRAVAGIDGEFELLNGNILFDVPCPPQLCDVTEAYAVQVSGESMWPRYRDGEIVYCDPRRRVKKGDFVVAQVMINEFDQAPQAFIKMFVRHNAEELILEQFNPAKQLNFPHNRVVSVHYIAFSGDVR